MHPVTRQDYSDDAGLKNPHRSKSGHIAIAHLSLQQHQRNLVYISQSIRSTAKYKHYYDQDRDKPPYNTTQQKE